MEITGRLKDVLIVRGTKHYPQDLEQVAAGRHGAVRPGCVAAFAVGRGSAGDRIALVAEVDPRQLETSAAAQDAIAAIRSGVADAHGVQLIAVALVAPGGVEKTTSGKVQRFACRDALLAGTLDALAIWRRAAPARGTDRARGRARGQRRMGAGMSVNVGGIDARGSARPRERGRLRLSRAHPGGRSTRANRWRCTVSTPCVRSSSVRSGGRFRPVAAG